MSPINDVESSIREPLYPNILEGSALQWGFLRKVYGILLFQLIHALAVAAAVVSVDSIAVFLASTATGLAVYIVFLILTIIAFVALAYYSDKHPVNLYLLMLFTIVISFPAGLTCAFTSGKIILETLILMTLVIASLFLYTFWGSRRGSDFNFLVPFLFALHNVLLVFFLIQFVFPMGKLSETIFVCLAVILFCAYIIYDTSSLLKRLSYDDYITASVAFVLDIPNVFLSIFSVCKSRDH